MYSCKTLKHNYFGLYPVWATNKNGFKKRLSTSLFKKNASFKESNRGVLRRHEYVYSNILFGYIKVLDYRGSK